MTNNTTAAALTDEQLTIQWAIESIEASAKSLQECHTQNGTWGDDTEAQSMFEREMEIASALRALLTSPRAAELPEGWKLVPIEPDTRMRCAAFDVLEIPAGYCGFENGTQARDAVYAAMLDAAPAAPVAEAEPIPMLLFCPGCGTQHIDRPESHAEADASIGLQIKEVVTWTNPPHRSHLCHECGIVWRPADVATVGVEAIETSGKADTWVKETPWIGHNRPVAQAVAADGDATDQGVAKAQSEFVSALILAICELPDRSSPEGEPGAMVANSDEIAHCVDVALEKTGLSISRRAAVSPATADEPAALDPAVLAVVESLSDANQPGNIKAQISYLMARVREDVLTHDGKMGGNTVLAENRLHALIGLAIRGARASQTAAPQANVAGERAAFVEKLRELGADISPLGSRDERLCITSNIMVDDVLAAARASQAAAPAEAREPVGDWLWRELMDYCRERGVAPANNDRLFEMVKRARKQFDSCAPADAGDAVAIGFRTRIPGFDWVPWLTDNQETIRKAIADALAIGSEASKLYSGPVQGAQGGKGGDRG